MQALRTAATGMAAQQLNVEVISHNIANMNTVGFKRERAEFQDLLYQTFQAAGAQSSDQGTIVPTGVQVGAGVKASAVYRVGTQGTMTKTDNQYDIAINGRGYLQVLLPSGENAYTRAGNLSVNDQGQLVTQDGYQIQPAITIPTDAVSVSISPSGQVEVTQAGQTASNVVGVLELATFVNDGGLEAVGGNLLKETVASGAPTTGTPGSVGIGTLQQGYTEASNVDAVAEITALIVAQRAYEMNSKVISTADNMLATANQVKA
ncbi:MAG: flagellar basal-body rod protein FlgG [Phenylobacterium sp. RIFCSPHIGHO2_01_FULL_69_31]|jgi:flagellar basal-body rod protein FlgG|uniref:flagellar basal-body rod protein FlgG n=1 Tax=Phenylobacterium sp. RIFCSPHIGHO2_01_FULL_69_31 TaxID=1801944 RepID=UPI0008C62E33|nr:flagellar basal-body rod protein FlgG [Phenylobacterium sp. RIFCSPHIGHO2_01_FULL_69_31]OHB28596.1 MAG: flagellar basal-body rod protein FlgG [Phenylobacterium sp. RIFCSPHIGHO2_01_FULL_69_31]